MERRFARAHSIEYAAGLAKEAVNSQSVVLALLSMFDMARAEHERVLGPPTQLVGNLHLGDLDLPEQSPVNRHERRARDRLELTHAAV